MLLIRPLEDARRFVDAAAGRAASAPTGDRSARAIHAGQKDTGVIHGGITSASRESFRPVIDEYKQLYFYNIIYEGGVCDKYVFVTGETPTQQMGPLAKYALKHYGTKAYTVAADYNFAHISWKWWDIFWRNGGGLEPVPGGKRGTHVGKVEFIPLDVTDFIWNAIAVEGATMLMVKGNSMGTNWKGYYTTSLLDAYARGWQSRANDLSETTKLVVLLGQYMQDNYHGRYYAKAQNLAHTLRAAYDSALQQADLLVMPTLPMKATPLPGPNASREEYVARALEMLPNTCPFDVTGHPALTVPVGRSEGLPVGMMLIGRHWEDGTVLRAGHAFEQLG